MCACLCVHAFLSLSLLCVCVYVCVCVSTQTAMPGMKKDCGGAAGILGAFAAAVKLVSLEIIRHIPSIL